MTGHVAQELIHSSLVEGASILSADVIPANMTSPTIPILKNQGNHFLMTEARLLQWPSPI
jgi:hypothetical protein